MKGQPPNLNDSFDPPAAGGPMTPVYPVPPRPQPFFSQPQPFFSKPRHSLASQCHAQAATEAKKDGRSGRKTMIDN
jgi:hypothetical protein